ncbi:MAG: hypothetical protein IJU58_03705 [Clostridia bacterium]|nr:hypothetical protein [Clostridia bacterium]
MQYNDDAIATNESMHNMCQSYAQLNKVNALKTENNPKTWDNSLIYKLYTQEIEMLTNLSNYAQNTNIREYLRGLASKSQTELDKLVQTYPQIDTSLDDNPNFFNRSNSSSNFKKFLTADLQIIDELASGMQSLEKIEEREVLFKFVNRHIKALQELFGLMHLLTFY